MTDKVYAIIEELRSLTLLEAAELVKQIESTFGVSASVPAGTGMVTPKQEVEQNVEQAKQQTEFSVILQEVPQSKKISILKVVRSITGLGLKEAKNLVESCPETLKGNLSESDVEDIRKKLEEVGAKVVVK